MKIKVIRVLYDVGGVSNIHIQNLIFILFYCNYGIINIYVYIQYLNSFFFLIVTMELYIYIQNLHSFFLIVTMKLYIYIYIQNLHSFFLILTMKLYIYIYIWKRTQTRTLYSLYWPENRAISFGKDWEHIRAIFSEQGEVSKQWNGWWARYPSHTPVRSIHVAQYSCYYGQHCDEDWYCRNTSKEQFHSHKSFKGLKAKGHILREREREREREVIGFCSSLI